ncbi:RING/U-box superfamily protein [Zea mays]|uniref:RING/U-box superfamily protein n=1 Tax=Zea mays TaxID=4577 RepID=A0A1D6GNT9_MAIZE|nr:RING/U-box superfamily protein [Zea mays]
MPRPPGDRGPTRREEPRCRHDLRCRRHARHRPSLPSPARGARPHLLPLRVPHRHLRPPRTNLLSPFLYAAIKPRTCSACVAAKETRGLINRVCCGATYRHKLYYSSVDIVSENGAADVHHLCFMLLFRVLGL